MRIAKRLARAFFSASPYWQGEIHRLRFDYFNASAPGDVMYIKSIELT